MGPLGPKQYIFGNQFYLEKARKLRFYVFLHFHARKHMAPEVAWRPHAFIASTRGWKKRKQKKSKMLLFLSFLATKIWQKVQRLSIFSPLHKSVSIRSYSGPYFPTFWPEQLRIRTLFTKCSFVAFQNQPFTGVLYNRSSEKKLKNAWGCHEAHFC